METEFCTCGRPLQPNSAAEMTGLCDHCREIPASERFVVGNRRGIDWKKFLLGKDPESCPCQECSDARVASFDEENY
jgi:hypothetical protein